MAEFEEMEDEEQLRAEEEEEEEEEMEEKEVVEEEIEEEEEEEEEEVEQEEEEGEEEQEQEANGEDLKGEAAAAAAAADTSNQGDGDGNGKSFTPPAPQHQVNVGGGSPGKIFVGGLAKEATIATFVKHFGNYGEITDSVIMKDRNTGQPRGFGFITYADPSVVDRVIQDVHVINGKQVEIKRTIPKGAIPGSKDFKTKKIFVGGIPPAITEDEFKSFFAKFGEVSEHMIMRDHHTNRSRGFGFITFDTEQAVDDLLANGNRVDFFGAQVEIKKAEPKKPSNPPPIPTKHFSNMRPAFGGRLRDTYGRGGGYNVGPYSSRPGAYGGYGGNEFGVGYEGYGGSTLGPYQGDSALGYSGRYGGGGFNRGYDMGGYEGYREYGSGAGGYISSLGSSSGLYGTRGGYGGSFGGRYHPYSR